MQVDYRCPNCNSTETRYRSTRRSHICQRCGHVWERQGVLTDKKAKTMIPTMFVAGAVALYGLYNTVQGDGPLLLICGLGVFIYACFMYMKFEKAFINNPAGNSQPKTQ